MPIPPRICTQRSATLNSSSETMALTIELSCRPLAPVSSIQHAHQIASRHCCSAISLSAIMKPTPWCSPSGLPKAVRVRACSTARDSAIRRLVELGANAANIQTVELPGAFEAPLMAKKLAESGQFDAVIACALIVNGGIYRHEFVTTAVIDGLAVQLDTGVPVFSVALTPLNFHDHEEHHSYFFNHFLKKGEEAASACAHARAARTSRQAAGHGKQPPERSGVNPPARSLRAFRFAGLLWTAAVRFFRRARRAVSGEILQRLDAAGLGALAPGLQIGGQLLARLRGW